MEQELIKGPIDGYKIVHNDLKCRGFQYKIGERVRVQNDLPLELCGNGLHFCKYPSGVWAYYREGRIFKVKAYGVLKTKQEPGADYKMVCKEIELVSEINVGGDRNTGNQNTGDRNTGCWNTGCWNTGDGNATDFSSGFFCTKEQPIVFFDKKTNIKRNEIDFLMVNRLCEKLSQDDEFDVAEFLSLPNATKKNIKALHKAHIKRRNKTNETSNQKTRQSNGSSMLTVRTVL